MIYSDFATPTLSTSADTAGTTATLTYNGVGGRLLFLWGAGGAVVATAAQGIKPYVVVTGTGVPGVQPNIPLFRWRSAYLAGASVGSVRADPVAFPVNWSAPANGQITFDVRNAASSTAPLVQVGACYGQDALPQWAGLMQTPWVLRDIPATCITATPTSVTTTAELGVGTLTVPPDYPTVVGIATNAVTNGVRVAAEEFIGTCRYTATGAGKQQFEPAQRWPFFGQQDAPVGVDAAAESYSPDQWHPIQVTAAPASTIQSLVTLRTAVTNATSFQVFAALK